MSAARKFDQITSESVENDARTEYASPPLDTAWLASALRSVLPQGASDRPPMAAPDMSPRVAVILPCYNEALTIAKVVEDFRAVLPGARIAVFDNNSTDGTASVARAAGAEVFHEPRRGKGNVVRRMFAEVDADVYLMADGDGTYDPQAAPDLISLVVDDHVDMAVGTRANVTQNAHRAGHAFGNRLFNRMFASLFGHAFVDIFSGYRAFSRRFVKSSLLF